MNREELYALVDIDDPSEFEYFENLADLLECDEDIPYDELYSLLREVDKGTLGMLIDDYFEEISDFLPEDDGELFLLMDQIRRSLKGLARGSEDENVLGGLTGELDRFRTWYSGSSEVICKDLATGEEQTCSLRDAIAAARLEKIDGERYSYDFEGCHDYKLDDYVMSFADMAAAAEE